jgi:pimeloyl-ACP methyl ester carboxylesterase
VRCDLTPEQAATLIPPTYARDSADVERRAAYSRTVAEQCARSSTARLLPHITMTNVARDMDEIRKSLREKRISYLGYSNGTQLGAYYSELFPSHTDRFVLDSLTGPGGLDSIGSRRWARGFEDRFPDFAAWAASRNATYGLGSTPGAVRAKYFELAGRLDSEPYSGVDGAAFRAMAFGLLFSDATFEPLAQVWQAIDQGGELPTPPPPPGGDAEVDFSGQLHLFCNRPGWPKDIATYQHNVARDRVRYPMFGAATANVWPCAYWPATPQPRVPIDSDGPSNLLLVNNLRDPGTPYAGAVEMRRALGDSARMITVNAGGHLAYLFTGNTCADNAVTTYLADGKRPAGDRFCVANG